MDTSTHRHLTTLAWLLMVTASLVVLLRYQATPGTAAAAPARWPAGTSLAPPGAEPTLLVFLHPRCTCSRATVHELARLLGALPRRPDVRAVMVRPDGLPEAEGLEEVPAALDALLPWVPRLPDPGGLLAHTFGATTSGHALVYAPDGALAYEGGLTGARAHQGQNAGAERVAALLRGEAAPGRFPVFGCPLRDHPGEAHAAGARASREDVS